MKPIVEKNNKKDYIDQQKIGHIIPDDKKSEKSGTKIITEKIE